MQEKLSLSDRFGLTLTFLQADQEIYLKIVHHLAKQVAINLPDEDLNFRALQWATRHNGQSGRTAQQFITFLQAELKIGRNHSWSQFYKGICKDIYKNIGLASLSKLVIDQL